MQRFLNLYLLRNVFKPAYNMPVEHENFVPLVGNANSLVAQANLIFVKHIFVGHESGAG
jgi:hypothetical protein